MGFFKDFKNDLSESANEVNKAVAESSESEKDKDVMVNTLDEKETQNAPDLSELSASYAKALEDESAATMEPEETAEEEETEEEQVVTQEEDEVETEEEETEDPEADENAIADETAIITAGLSVIGDLDSVGSIDVFGAVSGSVTCRGKLTVCGAISGNSKANEIFANSAQIDGDMEAKGSVKVGQGTVIVGNIKATSAVIAGAVKGDIDVHGPVIVDSTAVIVGDIKSKTVQINNGATVDGCCSQCYADVDIDAIFDLKNRKKKK